MSEKKIIFIASYPESLVNFRLHLIKEFLARQFTVCVIAPPDEKVMQLLSSIGVNYLALSFARNGKNPFHDLLLLKKIYELLCEEKPQYVFSYTIKPVIYGSLAARLAQVPNIYAMLTGTGYVFANNNLKSKIIGVIARSLFRLSLRFNKKLFFQNKDNLAEFLQYHLLKPEHPVAIINGSGVDIQAFQPAKLPEKISFLMIARFLFDKGIREYVAAARVIKERYPDIIFKLVGWIDTNPNAISQQELKDWINEGVVEYLGKLTDVRNALANSSVYVLPSYGEGTPRTVLEAMAMARPIITTDVPGCRETVCHKQNGFLVPARQTLALADAMLHFILHPADIEKMGAASREIAVTKYDVNLVNRSMLIAMNIDNDINNNQASNLLENTA